MNRQQRRNEERLVEKARRQLAKHGPGPVADPICEARGHAYPDTWVMRPAWVGAGISIPKVHFDRRCSRCRTADIVWVDIEGDTSPRDRAMPLLNWLDDHGATVRAPAGAVSVPDPTEMAAIAGRVIGR